jgi:RNA polymerase sigma factor (sigma-70 family)
MSDGPLSELVRHIRRIALKAKAADLDDGQLLERFLAQRDQAAFEVLLRRHGPMVLGVCRRLLRDPHDTEDAFQATFLVLLRKAASVRNRALFSNWLYGVAYRTALKARAQAARRSAHAKPLAGEPAVEPESELLWNDLRPVLDEEVQRLPSKYRLPVVLCYLEGKTFEQAAQQLGWPAGTVSGRLARARQLLRTRLTRRGLGLAAGLLGLPLFQTALEAMPSQLLAATVRAALAVTARHATAEFVIPTTVLTLMEGVLHAMLMTKLKIAATGLFLVAVIGGGAGLVAYPGLAAQPPNQQVENKPSPVAQAKQKALEEELQEKGKEEEEKIEKLQNLKAIFTPPEKIDAMLAGSDLGEKMKALFKARFDAANTEINGRWKENVEGRGALDILLNGSRRLLEAELALSSNKADHAAAWESHWQRTNQIYLMNLARYNAGRLLETDLKEADYFRIDAEIGLERAKAQVKQSKSS